MPTVLLLMIRILIWGKKGKIMVTVTAMNDNNYDKNNNYTKMDNGDDKDNDE